MAWGYVEGGMGRISFAIAESARAAGAVLASGVSVAEIRPGEGVVLEGGEVIRARAVVSNADPKVTAGLLACSIDSGFAARVHAWRTTSPVVKVNCGLSQLPRWTALPDDDWPNRAPVSIAVPIEVAQRAFEHCTRGIPSPGFAELYFQGAYDPMVAPPGKLKNPGFCPGQTTTLGRFLRTVRPSPGLKPELSGGIDRRRSFAPDRSAPLTPHSASGPAADPAG